MKAVEFISEKTHNVLNNIEKCFGVTFEADENITLYGRYGNACAVGKGITYSVCTSSYADGADHDYSEEIYTILQGLGFIEASSTGDNGMDSATNGRDTYWVYSYVLEDTIKSLY